MTGHFRLTQLNARRTELIAPGAFSHVRKNCTYRHDTLHMFLYFIFTFIFILFLKSLVRKGKTLTCELGGVGAIGSCLLSAAWRLLGRVHAATALFLWRVLLTECDLAECDLTECDLAGCDLVECVWLNTA